MQYDLAVQYDIELRGLVSTDSARRLFTVQHDDGLIGLVITDSDSDSESCSTRGNDEIDGSLSKTSVESMSSSTLVDGVIGNSEQLESDRS